MKKLKFLYFIFLCLSLTIVSSVPVLAAGLLGSCPNGGGLCEPSKLIFPTYKGSGDILAVPYKLDRGSFGDFSNSEINQAVDEVLGKWNQVPSSKIKFTKEDNGLTDQDITDKNFLPILNPKNPIGFNIIVLDNQGKIIEDIFGKGAKTSVLGFAGPSFIDYDREQIIESNALFNGLLFSESGRNQIGISSNKDKMLRDFKSTTLHEFGHMIGLDHSQIFLEEYEKTTKGILADINDIPVMFPILVNPLGELLWDDMVSISAPVAYRNNIFRNDFGKISGKYLKANGSGVRGGNLVAYKVDDRFKTVVSSSSDIFVDGKGDFLLEGLKPGEYIIKAERVFSEFKGASSVGPYRPPKLSENIQEGFYMGAGLALVDSTLSEAINQAQRITVEAGQEVENINIGAIGSIATNPDKSFKIGGKILSKNIRLKNNKERAVKIALKNISNAPIRVELESDQADLIRFAQESFLLNKKAKKIKIFLASGKDFKSRLSEDPDLQINSKLGKNSTTIKLRVIDTTNNFEEERDLNLVF